MRILGIVLALFFTLHAQEITNGTIVLLELDATKSISLSKNETSLPLLKHPTDTSKLISFIAVPYRQTKPIELLYTSTQGTQTLLLHVNQKEYQKEILSVEPSKVAPSQESLARIKQENEEAHKIYQTFTPKRYWSQPYQLPLENAITSNYGNARIFNGSLQSYHTGTDFRAAVGTVINASNDGVVVLAKERYYAGGSVIIDHGEGIYSVYYHLSHSDLHVGDTVKQGERIGLSGATGRVTGPHLHFGYMVQDIPVDPIDFMNKINALF